MSNYSFLDIACALVGPGVAANLGNGAAVAEEGISVAPTGDKNTMTVGADGEGQHSLHGDKSGTMTVRLLKNSPMNAVLSAAYALQTNNPALHGTNTIVITDKQRGDVVSARQVAFKKMPDLNYAKVGELVEWQFDAVRIDFLLGV
jgi:hypothetical protein